MTCRRSSPSALRSTVLTLSVLLITLSVGARAGEFGGPASLLPAGSELGDEALDRPREIFRSEAAGGHKSYLVLLGDVAFSSPETLGGLARQAGISCGTCHVNGSSNPRLYVPGLSTVAGNFDTTNPLFNVKADDGVLNPVTVPSLRGAHLLAPYGHDGRILSLRDFVRNVIVNEFAGPEPSAHILDAIVLYIEDIDFVPNPRLGPGGRLTGPMSEAEKHGEELFRRPFAHDPSLSCAGCHQPEAAFVDHRQHDVGSGGFFKTPTLLNANFNGPYFHDGRYANYAQVVAHFDRAFYLGLSGRDRQDLVAYLEAVGDGEQALVTDSVAAHVKELTEFASVLETALSQHDVAVVTLTVDTLDLELRDLTEAFPERRDPTVQGGVRERSAARAVLKNLVLRLHEIDSAAQGSRFDEAAAALGSYHNMLRSAVPVLQAASPWSLFDRPTHDSHFAAVRKLYRAGVDPALAPPRRLDRD